MNNKQGSAQGSEFTPGSRSLSAFSTQTSRLLLKAPQTLLQISWVILSMGKGLS